MFAKFFKPRWQHSKAIVRIRAIERLSMDRSEDREVLARLARQDQSPEVRLAAVKRIDTPALLSDIATHESDPDVRRRAADRICKIILNPAYPQSQQKECLQYLQDDNMLAHIALNSSCPEIQILALNSINDQHCLLTLTLNGATSQLRQNAATKLELPELLEQAEKGIKGRDKSVFRILRNKQQAFQENARLAEQYQQRRHELLDSLEHLSHTEHYPLYASKLDALQQQWQQIEDEQPADQDLSQRYQQLCQSCQAVISKEQERNAAQQADQEQQKRIQQQQKALQQQLQECLRRCQELLAGSFSHQDLQAEQQCWESVLNQAETHSFTHLDSQFNALYKAGIQWLNHADEVTQLREQLQDATEQSTPGRRVQAINALFDTICWPEQIAAPQPLSALAELRNRLQQQQKQISQRKQTQADALQNALDQLESEINSGNSRQAIQLEEKLGQQINGLNGSTPKQLLQRYKNLQARVTEFKQWQGYAIVPKKEALCEQMEALIHCNTDPAQLAQHIRKLQQSWKALDAEDPLHSHSLWKRFKAASDLAYAPCETYFKEQKLQRENNLKQRKRIVTELTEQLHSQDWDQADWNEIEKLSRHVKQQWKDYAPVDRTPGRQVQSDFNSLLKQLDGQIKSHREDVAQIKQALLGQALELTETTDLQAAAETVKQLQQQWKQAGSTFHQTERTLWPQFRAACNSVFEQFNQQKQIQQQSSEASGKLEQMLESRWYQAMLNRISLCDQLENMLLNGTLDQLALDQLQHSWEQCDDAGRDFGPRINKRYETLLALISDHIEMPELLTQTETNLRQLCIRLEIMLGHDSPEQDQALRLEYQMDRLQKALQQCHQTASPVDLKKLELEWQCQPFTLQHEALQIRFYSHLEQVR